MTTQAIDNLHHEILQVFSDHEPARIGALTVADALDIPVEMARRELDHLRGLDCLQRSGYRLYKLTAAGQGFGEKE